MFDVNQKNFSTLCYPEFLNNRQIRSYLAMHSKDIRSKMAIIVTLMCIKEGKQHFPENVFSKA